MCWQNTTKASISNLWETQPELHELTTPASVRSYRIFDSCQHNTAISSMIFLIHHYNIFDVNHTTFYSVPFEVHISDEILMTKSCINKKAVTQVHLISCSF